MTTRLLCPAGMKAIPEGTFSMGERVDVSLDSYCLDTREVTVAEYAACVDAGGCTAPELPATAPGGPSVCNWPASEDLAHPINCISWEQARQYCARLGKQLPTEAQWEYAARGGSSAARSEETLPAAADACWDPDHERKGTCKVGSFPPRSFGLLDMAGNVSEWVLDWYGPLPPQASKNYRGPSQGSTKISRGGAWLVTDPTLLRSTVRLERPTNYRGDNVGFRCASAGESR
jgi:formylglycine-generating enzyme required for sulfatase activity